MPSPLQLSRSRTYPVPVEAMFDALLPVPLETLFSRRYGPIPPISGTRQDGVWGIAGQRRRTVLLAGGGSMQEELLSVDRPHLFAYRISGVTGPMKRLAASIDGSWSFEPVGTGVRVTWRWTLHPASGAVVPILPLFARLWRGYARQALERVEELRLGLGGATPG
ncbi:MAG: SRPBCC family protein [Jatrophihabitans sp.]|uniref:SRPBCC family protein n=1 Tax=Jatrophihabitans sp. TaxID=1932789 RepID=UPI003F81EA49